MTDVQPEAVTSTSTSPDSLSSGKGNATDTPVSVAQYGLPQKTYSTDDLEVHTEGDIPQPQVATVGTVSSPSALLAFSRRKAMVVSIIITVLVTLLTGVSMLLL